MYRCQVKAMQAQGPASSYHPSATTLVLGCDVELGSMAGVGIGFLLHKLGLATLLALAFCGSSQVVQYLCASWHKFPLVHHATLCNKPLMLGEEQLMVCPLEDALISLSSLPAGKCRKIPKLWLPELA